ncbi:MAG: isochorismatase family protein [Clostridiales bacterium]|nr:isochorismatase family protein [Clostridiales bacterium]
MKLPHLRRENAAVLIIDLQERLLPAMPDREPVLKNALVLAEMARTFELPLLCSEQYPRGLGPTAEPLATKLREQQALIIEKTSFSTVLPELLTRLEETGRRQIIVSGVETHVCVFQTVRDLAARDYDVYVPWDAVNSRDPKNMAIALEQFRRMGVHITSTETVLFDLLQDSKDPHFKELQALIK